METNKEVLHDIYGLPFMFFERPSWDRFPGAARTFASDVLNPDGRVIQQPSTHMIAPSFSKAFNITYKDEKGKIQPAYTTCYGPAISRIFASVVIVHGDDKGLKFPWEIAPLNVIILPIQDDEKIIKKAESIKKEIEEFTSVDIDFSEKSAGEKFNHWEMKGVPIRIDLGLKDLGNGKITIFRRDLDEKEVVNEKDLVKRIKEISKEFTKNLIKKADKLFKGRIKKVNNLEEMKKAIKEGAIVKCNFCSVGEKGVPCAEVVEKDVGAEVRGTRLNEEDNPSGKCVICGKKSKEIVYIAKSY